MGQGNCGKAIVVGLEEVAQAEMGLDRRLTRSVLNWGGGQR